MIAVFFLYYNVKNEHKIQTAIKRLTEQFHGKENVIRQPKKKKNPISINMQIADTAKPTGPTPIPW